MTQSSAPVMNAKTHMSNGGGAQDHMPNGGGAGHPRGADVATIPCVTEMSHYCS